VITLLRRLLAYLFPSSVEVQADDHLLDEAGGREVRSVVQDPAAAVLAEWRGEIDRAAAPAADDAVLRMLAGANFGPDSKLILPSGVTLDGDEAQAMTSFYAPDGEHRGGA
jgi:hypothetical protein